MPVGPVRDVKLTEPMADKGPLWSRMLQKHGCKALPYEQFVGWRFADFQWPVHLAA